MESVFGCKVPQNKKDLCPAAEGIFQGYKHVQWSAQARQAALELWWGVEGEHLWGMADVPSGLSGRNRVHVPYSFFTAQWLS